MTLRSENIIIALAVGLVLAFTYSAYYPGLSGDYVFDDFPNILKNNYLQLSALDKTQLASAALSSDSGPLGRPISMASFALNLYYFGISPYSLKVTNLAIHLINGVLLFTLTTLLITGSRHTQKTRLSHSSLRWLAILISAAWLLHPLNLTSVLYIVQRMTSLSALFVLGALCIYTFGRIRMLNSKPGLFLILIAPPMLGAIGLLCKETAALLPLYIFTIELIVFRFRCADGTQDRRLLAIFIVAFLALFAALLCWLLPTPGNALPYAGREFTLPQRLLTEARVIFLYIKWAIFPNIRELGLYHDDISISQGILAPPTTAISLLFLISLGAIAYFLRNKNPLFTFGIMWFFMGHLLESTILPLEIAHEHRNYLPDYGILVALFSFAIPTKETGNRLALRFTVMIVYVSSLAVVTWIRADQWKDNIIQAQFEAIHHPDSPRAVFALGRIYTNLAIAGHLKDHEKPIATLERARRLDARSIMPEIGLILASGKLGTPLDPSWLSSAAQKLSDRPLSVADITSLHALVKCPIDVCNISDSQIENLIQSAMTNPRLQKRSKMRADLSTIYASHLLNRRHDVEAAEKMFTLACNSSPNEPQYRINLIKFYIAAHKWQLATREIEGLRNMDDFGRLEDDILSLEMQIPQKAAFSENKK